MADNNSGQLLLNERDFVKVFDDEGNELAPVPKHWKADQLAPGSTKTKKTADQTSADSVL